VFLDPARSGPLITPAAKERVEKLIQTCTDQGGKILLDGRGVKVDGYPNGNFVGPTILEATTDMDCYTCVPLVRSRARLERSRHVLTRSLAPPFVAHSQEIFGPVLTIVKAATLDDAINVINSNQCAWSSRCISSLASRSHESELELILAIFVDTQTATARACLRRAARRRASSKRRSRRVRSACVPLPHSSSGSPRPSADAVDDADQRPDPRPLAHVLVVGQQGLGPRRRLALRVRRSDPSPLSLER